jgi:hypothetical protein
MSSMLPLWASLLRHHGKTRQVRTPSISSPSPCGCDNKLCPWMRAHWAPSPTTAPLRREANSGHLAPCQWCHRIRRYPLHLLSLLQRAFGHWSAILATLQRPRHHKPPLGSAAPLARLPLLSQPLNPKRMGMHLGPWWTYRPVLALRSMA